LNSPRVSVVIPTFNRAALCVLAVDSVLRQTFADIEIIVVDDGSTDDTVAQLARFGKLDRTQDGIRYVRQPNRGMNPARNVGLALARGEYVALLDSDDLWEPWKIELQVALLDRFPKSGFTFSDFTILRASTGTTGEKRAAGLATWHSPPYDWNSVYDSRADFASLGIDVPLPRREFDVFTGDIYPLSLRDPVVLPSTALIRRAALERSGVTLPEVQSTHGDWEFFARLSHAEGALYAAIETTLNRSHEDAVRLTRLDPGVRLARRISMIDRVWRADPVFCAQHGADIDAVQHALLLRLARLQVLHSNGADARATLDRAAALMSGGSTRAWATKCLSHVPGSGPALRAAQRAANAMYSLMSVARVR
jgi:glycosyltransferase involved in cell wall biosynthesis